MSKRTKLAADLTRAATLPFTIESTKAPEYQQPYQLVSFSTTPQRKLVFDDSALKYYVQPPPNADLSYRYQHWIKRPEEKSRLDGLLEACLRNKQSRAETRRADAITWRGVMTKIFTAPYENRDRWHLNVMSVNGTLYLEEHLTAQQLIEKEDMDPQHRTMTYFGYSFESFCTRSDLDSKPHQGWGGDVDTNVEWCSVVKSKLGEFRIIVGGEVDCVQGRYTGQPDTFLELKTSMEIRRNHQGDRRKFESKLLKFFTQSYLLGVPDIIVGFRSREGILQSVMPLKTANIPALVQRGTNQWDQRRCRAFAYETLKFMQAIVGDTRPPESGEREVWRLSNDPNVGLTMRLLTAQEVEEVRGGEDRVGFLPTQYWNTMNTPSTSEQ